MMVKTFLIQLLFYESIYDLVNIPKRISVSTYGLIASACKIKVNHQQRRSVPLRPIRKIPIPVKWLISPLPEMINQICKKYSLEKS